MRLSLSPFHTLSQMLHSNERSTPRTLFLFGCVFLFWLFHTACSPKLPTQVANCISNTDCTVKQKCQNRICVSIPSIDGGLPWESIPQVDGGHPPSPDAHPTDNVHTDGDPSGKECTHTGQTRACTAKTKDDIECTGTQTCIQGKWTKCEAQPSKELCDDGKDNDCDGQVDEGPDCLCPEGATELCYSSKTGCTLTPKGTYSCLGECKHGTRTCRDGKWSQCEGEQGPTTEVCGGNSKDENCNGTPDEGCDCINNKIRKCYTGPAGTLGKGECKHGTQICVNGKWGACNNQELPSTEQCNGTDDDCDGKIDNIPEVDREDCNNQTGVCKGSKKECVKGKWQKCPTSTYQKRTDYERNETLCDGLDNNCDGKVDNIDTKYVPNCNNQTGVCKGSKKECGGSQGWLPCTEKTYTKHSPTNYKKQETTQNCDGLDNDCDGKVDEGCQCTNGTKQLCYSKGKGCIQGAHQNAYKCAGLCKTGTQICVNGKWAACVGDRGPVSEQCNGKDDDCDGKIDNIPDNKRPKCVNQQGVCLHSAQRCIQGKWEKCGEKSYTSNNAAYQTTETKCDGLDNNCDGKVDNIDTKHAPNCSNQQGVCKGSKKICSQGTWYPCNEKIYTKHNPNYKKEEDILDCDGLDNDCDGKTDLHKNGARYQPLQLACDVNLYHIPPKKGVCRYGIRECKNGSWSTCKEKVYARIPREDGLDNSCDGDIDETFSCKQGNVKPCYSGGAGCRWNSHTKAFECRGSCKAGLQKCEIVASSVVGSFKTQWSPCQGDTLPTQDGCNDQLDNDCDGLIDNHSSCSQVCSAGQTRPCYSGPACSINNSTSACFGTTQKCKRGIQSCQPNGKWGHCVGSTVSQVDRCDGLAANQDDDCDGQIDENCGTGGHDFIQFDPALFSQGKQLVQRGIYTLKGIEVKSQRVNLTFTTGDCTRPLIITPQNTKHIPTRVDTSYTCIMSGTRPKYTVHMFAIRLKQRRLILTRFHAIRPKHGTFGHCVYRTSPSQYTCSFNTRDPGRPAPYLDNNPSYSMRLFDSRCVRLNANRPIPVFASIYGTQGGFVQTSVYGAHAGSGKCAVRTFAAIGTQHRKNFGFWIPDAATEQWSIFKGDKARRELFLSETKHTTSTTDNTWLWNRVGSVLPFSVTQRIQPSNPLIVMTPRFHYHPTPNSSPAILSPHASFATNSVFTYLFTTGKTSSSAITGTATPHVQILFGRTTPTGP